MASRIVGATETIQYFNRLAERLPEANRRFLRDVSLDGERLGKQKIRDEDRIDTGLMLKEYKGEIRRLEVELTSRVPYFRFQDLGTINISPAGVSDFVFLQLPPLIKQRAEKHYGDLINGRL